MNFEDFLPVGSVVLLKNAQKKIVIIGVMQIKYMDNGQSVAYDYIGVPYPEGYLGQESALLFNHENIHEVIFKGYENRERELLVQVIQQMTEETDKVVNDDRGM